MITLEQFKENAIKSGICDEYKERFFSCNSKKELFEMALSVKAIDYLFDSIAKGWGISSQEICNRFPNLINGRYILKEKGYTSKLYCKYSDKDIVCDTTLLALIDCDCDVIVPKNHICEIYVVNSNINIKGNGVAFVVSYGEKANISISDKEKVKVKVIHKKDRDK